jgi:hypothetical protein
MVTQYDDKGKFFTRVINKKPVAVLIQSTRQTIRGIIHVQPNERIIDELNSTPAFLAVTDAELIAPDGSVAYTSKFLSLNTSQIIWIIPIEEISAGRS